MATDYEKYGKKYYHAHKDEINEYRLVSGVGRRGSEKHYQLHTDAIRRKNLAHYHRKRSELCAFVSLARLVEAV